VLIVEQLGDSQLTEQTRKRSDIVTEHAGSALGNAREHHAIFLLPVWKLLGKSKRLIVGETLPKTLAVTSTLVALIAVLLFLPWDFKPYCTGTLMPTSRQRIFSPMDAEIKWLPEHIDHGVRVRGPSIGDDGIAYRGDTLLELRSTELESLREQLQGEEREILARRTSLVRQLQEPRLSEFDRAELVMKQDQANIQLETVRGKLAIFEQYQKPDLFITSPMDGVIISWRIKDRLTEKLPISRMQYVMEIADLDGDWHLELQMPEKNMGHIARQKERLQGAPLRVEFFLASQPGTKYYGKVTEIHDRAEVRSEAGNTGAMSNDNINTVAIKVAIDDLESLRSELYPGAECRAQIDCGKRALGYVIFHEVIVYVQKNILFRWF
jgi:hypothetical protein